MATATTAHPISGDKLYQKRARAALPILVRQAEAATPISYSSLAQELGMPNPRNLNFVLGSIGQTLERLQLKKERPIPPIQCLVVNKTTGLPGDGIGWFVVKKEDFSKLSLKRRREIVQSELQRIYAYSNWQDLLEELNLEPLAQDFTPELNAASSFYGSGESKEHRELKEFVAKHPTTIGLPHATPKGKTEVRLASGDCLDISFRTKSTWIAAEIKSVISPPSDIARGIFQCVKYRAVLDAELLSKSQPQNSRAILVLGGCMPSHLIPLANILGVEFVQCITAAKG
ncbi:hypothetical protein [Alcaligenes faecalis]|uniref:hypothetical protein n=1 Tax=Alcaligenes faecalis TaxID=511 RepID=UPI0024BD04F1|nr:hypothetical protein [Alcaligenes faecalis]WHQ44829.1 hypothetical protein E8D21_15205 [Alcaligenes faecalis]